MQNKTADEMSDIVADILFDKFEDKIRDCVIYDIVEEGNNKSFNIDFQAYNFYEIKLSYKNGKINWSIKFDDKTTIDIERDVIADSETNLNLFFEEMQKELEMRIPDKFLQANGWE